jgi:hypothetical protein
MAFGLLTSPARHAPGRPFARAQADDDAGRVDRPEAIKTIADHRLRPCSLVCWRRPLAAQPVPFAQHQVECAGKQGWSDPAPPIRIFANIYDVGTCGVVVLLITGRKGHILIDRRTAEAAPEVARNIERLGFKLTDIRLMLASHEHLDHVGRYSRLQRLTGARLMVMPEARYALESGLLAPGRSAIRALPGLSRRHAWTRCCGTDRPSRSVR